MKENTPACTLRSLIFIPLATGELRPVPAERLGGECYRILGVRPEGEQWRFDPGQVVECEQRQDNGSERLVAVRVAG